MRVTSTLLLAVLVLRPLGVSADDAVTAPTAPTAATRAMTDAEIAARLTYIDMALEGRDGYAKFWRYGWMTVFAIGAVGGTVLGTLADDQRVKNDSYVGAFTSLLGVSGMIITPVDSGANLRKLREYPGDATTGGAAKLAVAERILEETAESERRGRAWDQWAQSYAVSIGSGLLMWLYFDQPESFWIKTGTGAVFSTARILTTPRDARRAWEHYQRGDLAQPVAGLGGEPGLSLAVTPGLASVTYRF